MGDADTALASEYPTGFSSLPSLAGGGSQFAIYVKPTIAGAVFPHWFLLLLVAVFVAAPWLPWRYRTCTLLIVMTLAAIGLGCFVYVIRE
jgi:hypothetical protein